MRRFIRKFPIIALWLMSAAHGELEADGLWARASVPGSETAAIYGVLHNTGTETLIIDGVETGVAGKAQFHHSKLVDGMSRMAHLPTLTLKPSGRLVFEPGARHIMLMGVTESLEEGSSFEIELILDGGERVTTTVRVGSIGQMTRPDDE